MRDPVEPRTIAPRPAPRLPALPLLALLVLLLAACSGDGPPRAPVLAELEPGVWNRVDLPGDAACADGSDYAIFVRPADPERVVIGFQGGGACWSAALCSAPATPGNGWEGIYLGRVRGPPAESGIHDADRPDNPFAGWTSVQVSYCTGDVHVGTRDADYPLLGEPVLHRGAINALEALDWTFANLPAPERAAVIGCSAGAYGAAVHAPRVRARWPAATFALISDAGVGVVDEGFAAEGGGLRTWGMAGALPAFVEGLDPDEADPYRVDFLERVVLASLASDAYPPYVALAHSSVRDPVQIGFYALMAPTYDEVGLPPVPLVGPEAYLSAVAADWEAEMRATLADLEAGAPDRFASWVSTFDPNGDPGDGAGHCLLTVDAFYEVAQEGGMAFSEWVEEGLEGRGAPGSVRQE